jgi:hypothetical protein
MQSIQYGRAQLQEVQPSCVDHAAAAVVAPTSPLLLSFTLLLTVFKRCCTVVSCWQPDGVHTCGGETSCSSARTACTYTPSTPASQQTGKLTGKI